MPKIMASSTGSRPPLSCCPSLEYWHKYYACPATGSGQRLVHKWLLTAANACKHFGLSLEEAADWIEINMSRRPDSKREIPDQVSYAYGTTWTGSGGGTRPAKDKPEALSVDALEAMIDRSITDPVEHLRQRSPMPMDIKPSGYLRAISRPGEHFVAMARKDAFGPYVRLWKQTDSQDAQPRIDERVDDLANTSQQGAWFLSCPVNGIEVDDSLRRETNITVFRHAVLECDCPELGIDPADWLRFLIGRSLPIISIIDSGKRGAHAIINAGTSTKEELLAYIDSQLKPWTICGTDPACLSAYRLTRLANCWRGETGKRQQLLYLNPDADGTPIKELTEIQTNVIQAI